MKLNYTISQNYLDKSYKGTCSCQDFQLENKKCHPHFHNGLNS
jgi:hypothetical protein